MADFETHPAGTGKELDALREALAWCLEHGVTGSREWIYDHADGPASGSYRGEIEFNGKGCGCCSSRMNVPPELSGVLRCAAELVTKGFNDAAQRRRSKNA